MAKKTKSSHRWLARQRKDPYALQAQRDGVVSRAHYKLEQLDRRFNLLRSGSVVLELGAAPGGWTHYVADRVGSGRLIACDSRPITAPASVVVIEGEAGTEVVDAAIAAALGPARCDLVISDMAPNITGVRAADQAASMYLADLAADYARRFLKPGGNLVVKMFQGEGIDAWVAQQRELFRKCQLVKPRASRTQSREVFAMGLSFQG